MKHRLGRLLAVLALTMLGLALAAGVASADKGVPVTKAVSEFTYDRATVTGTVDPKDHNNWYWFEYSTDQTSWTGRGPTYTEERQIPANSGLTQVEENLTKLRGGTHYYVRLAAMDDVQYEPGYSSAPYLEFTTPPVVPPKALKLGIPTGITFFTANFTGEVERPANPDSAFDAHCRLEYVSDVEYNPRNEVQKLYIYARAGTYTLIYNGERTEKILFNAPASIVQSKLEALPAVGAGNVSVTGGPGDLQASNPYFIEYKGALGFTDVAAIEDDAEGLVGNPTGDTYLETIAPGHGEEKFNKASNTPCTPDTVTTPSAKAPVEIPVQNLTQGTTYHVRLVAENAGGPDYLVGPNFSTVLAPPPTVTMHPIVEPGPTSVEAKSTINPNGTRTVAWFEYSANNGESWHNAPYGDDNIPLPYWCDSFGGDDACSRPLYGSVAQSFNATINEPNINSYFGIDPVLLEPNTSYTIRIHAQNPGGMTTSPAVPFKTKNVPPAVQTLNGNGGPETAKLGGRVNPKNAPVTYQFEWGVREGEGDETYENADPTPAEGLPLADNTLHLVSTTITGLEPSTTYHFRITGTNTQTETTSVGADRVFTTRPAAAGPPECPNETSRVGRSANLPDCRVYEFASPGLNQADIPVQDIGWVHSFGAAVSPDGNSVVFNPFDAPIKALGSHIGETVVAKKDPAGGWEQVESLAPPNLVPTGEFVAISHIIVNVSPDLREAIAVTDQPIAGPGSPQGLAFYLRQADGKFIPLTPKSGGLIGYYQVTATSQDYKRIFFEPGVPQLDEDPYLGYPFGGQTYEWDQGKLRLVSILPDGKPSVAGGRIPYPMNGKGQTVTPDGKSVLFVDGSPHLYLRIDAKETVDVSLPQRSTPLPNPITAPRPVGISTDGNTVLFLSRSELTDDSFTGMYNGNPDQGFNLYRYDVEKEELTDLTVDKKSENTYWGPGVRQVVRASEDFSYIYFIANGSLAPGATPGAENLYVWHDGTIKFIATDVAGNPESGFMVDATPDGKSLIFNSSTNATAYESNGKQMTYKYTYGGGVECMSCRPSGVKPGRDATTGFTNNLISNDGSRAFFVTADKLVPQATNGVQNVYEYTDGVAHLLTPGDTEDPIAMAGASESGDDVFLATTEELAKGEGRAWAFYDARVNAVVPQDVPSSGCQGENCRGPRTEGTGVTSPGTASFEAINRVAASAPKSVRGAKVAVRVIAPGAGTIAIEGRGLKPATLQVGKAGSASLTMVLKPSANKRRKRTGDYRTKGEVLFTAGNGDISRADVTLKYLASKGGGR